MTAIVFDTLKLARRLEGAGFSRDQADGAAEAIAESLSADIATKTDIAEVKTEIAKLGSDLRSEMHTEFASVRTEIASLRGDIAGVRSTTAQWIVGAAFVNVVGMLGAVAAVWQLAHK